MKSLLQTLASKGWTIKPISVSKVAQDLSLVRPVSLTFLVTKALQPSKFRILLLGIRVLNATADHALQVDGKGDEIYVTSSITLSDNAGNVMTPTPTLSRTSKTYGDVTGYGYRIKMGHASANGGIVTGDDIPYSNPYMMQYPPKVDEFPMEIFNGEIGYNQILTISPTIWEYDGGQDFFTAFLEHIQIHAGDLIKAGVDLYNAYTTGGMPVDASLKFSDFVKKTVDSGTAALTNLLIDVIGKAGDRPIGVSVENNKPVFRQQTIVLTQKIAEWTAKLSYGPSLSGILEVKYTDDQKYWGNYILYIKVEKI